MKGNNAVTILAVLVAAGTICYAAGSRAAQTASQPVLVTNTTSQCVPVSLYHSIAVPVTQSGSWSVKATNTSSTPIFVRDVDSPAHTGASYNTSITLPAGSSMESASFVVDAGFTFIVRAIQGWSNSGGAGSQPAELFVEAPTLHGTFFWGGVYTTVPSDPNTGILSNTNAYMAIPSGTKVTIYAERSTTTANGTANISMSGDLVPSS